MVSAIRLTDLYPVYLIELGAAIVVVIVIIGLIYKLRKWMIITNLSVASRSSSIVGPGEKISIFFKELINRVLLQRDVIVNSSGRRVSHYFNFFGFILCGVATLLVYVYYPGASPRPLTDPAKIIGNIGGILLVAGGIYLVFRLLTQSSFRRDRTLADLSFMFFLFLTAVTGFGTQFARLSGDVTSAYAAYTLHLFFVAALLVTAPFTHFIHAITVPLLRMIDRIYTVSALRTANVPSSRALKEEEMLEQVKRQVIG